GAEKTEVKGASGKTAASTRRSKGADRSLCGGVQKSNASRNVMMTNTAGANSQACRPVILNPSRAIDEGFMLFSSFSGPYDKLADALIAQNLIISPNVQIATHDKRGMR